MNTKQIILIAVGVLVIGGIIGGAFFISAKQASTTPAPTPTPPPLVTEAPTPLVTEVPTTTPTKAPLPTKSATSTPTAKPTTAPTSTTVPTPTVSLTPTPTPGVVNIEASVTPATASVCSQVFSFKAKIYTNAGVTVKYKWLRSDGASASEQTLTYDAAGMKEVTTDWSLGPLTSGNSVNGWQRIEITSPGSGLSNKAEFTMSCP